MKRFLLILTVCLLLPALANAQKLANAVMNVDTVALLQLLKEGANPNEVDNSRTTPLILACRSGVPATVRLLLKYGAKVDEPRTPKGRTPLMVAIAYYGGIGVCKLLVENGADVNAVADDGTTPLIIAAAGTKLTVVEYLLSKGANTKVKDKNGRTALSHAENINQTQVDQIKGIKDCVMDQKGVIALLKDK